MKSASPSHSFVAANYLLDVIRHEPRLLVLRGHESETPLPPPVQRLVDVNLQLTTRWATWSACSHCDREGIRRRFGDCQVDILDRHRPSIPWQQLRRFRQGVPCRSTTLLPRRVRTLKAVVDRPSVTFVEPCFVPCSRFEEKVVEVKDEEGRVVKRIREGVGYAEEEEEEQERVNITAPTVPPTPQKRVVREVVGTSLVMTCPSNKRRPIVKWFKDGRKMSPLKLRKATRSRIVIDKRRRVHVRAVRYTDAGRYDCYLDGYLEGK